MEVKLGLCRHSLAAIDRDKKTDMNLMSLSGMRYHDYVMQHYARPCVRLGGPYVKQSSYCRECLQEAIAKIDRIFAPTASALAIITDLLEFIKTFDMGGDWCQENYPAIMAARAFLENKKRE